MAQKRDGQSGSAHVILIVVLILAIVGGIGYVGYRALTKNAATPAQSAQVQSASSAKRELTFDNWDVAIDIPKTSNLYLKQYVDIDGKLQANIYEVYDTNFDRVCPYTWPNGTSLGSITRAKLDDQADTYFADPGQTNREYFTKNAFNSAIYGDYVYYYIKPNGSYGCLDSSKADSAAADKALGDSRTTFINALSSLHLTTK